jgi:hypothetical protein
MLRQPDKCVANADVAPFNSVASQLIPASAFSDTVELVDSTQQLFAILREYLAIRFGAAGFQTMFDRALRLATAVQPSLRMIRARPDGSIAGLDDLFWEHPSEEAANATIALLAELLSVVATFVGHEMTVRLLRHRWPWILVHENEATRVGARN